jgi:ligand-binding SRPBCC domain-containing protein
MSDSSIHVFDGQLDLPIGIEEAWAFFATPLNLAKVTPPSFSLKLNSEHQFLQHMYPGQFIVYELSLFLGLPSTWATEITQIQHLHYFVDEQRVGPFALWHHEHHFQEIPGGTRVRDIVHYKLPFGAIGDALFGWLIKRQVSALFAYRRDVLKRRFGKI